MPTFGERHARVRFVLDTWVQDGRLPGALVLLRSDADEVIVTAGNHGIEPESGPVRPDSIFRIASITKPITAAAALTLVDEGSIALSSRVAEWLPELAHPVVVRAPSSALDDVVPASRPITLEDLLTSRSGWGFPPAFDLPAVQALFAVQRDGRRPHAFPPADQWIAELSQVPMIAQPGSEWLYDTSYTILGILIERITGKTLGDVIAERISGPLGMIDTGFTLPERDLPRFAHFYDHAGSGLSERDDREIWTTRPALELGNGGLVGTASDWARFARMLLGAGELDSTRVLKKSTTAEMMRNHLTTEQSERAGFFLDGQGWGFGGSVDTQPLRVWQRNGRFGWVGGSGTSGFLDPATGDIVILMTQVAADRPGVLPVYDEVWTAAAR
jgi:CubicO group peptidase (beta-lactamase class C family)